MCGFVREERSPFISPTQNYPKSDQKEEKVKGCWLFLMSVPFYINRDPKVTGLAWFLCTAEHSHPNLPVPRAYAPVTRSWIVPALLCDQHILWFLFNCVRFCFFLQLGKGTVPSSFSKEVPKVTIFGIPLIVLLDLSYFSDNCHQGPHAWSGLGRDTISSTLILLHLFPCQFWSAPQDPLGTRRSPPLALMIWAGSVHSNSCNSSIGSSRNNSQSRGQWWQTGSKGDRGKTK